MTMISVKSLRVDYENITAVKDISFDIEQGQIYGLVGPNGAGKTSTLKAIAGLLEPTYGDIRIGGFDLEIQREKALLSMGFMPDFSPVYENLKVWEYLDVFGAAYLMERGNRISEAKKWVDRVNLSEKWDVFVRELSRGMRQRLVLAKTLLPGPKVLLLDEPASGLDPMARLDLQNILEGLAAEGRTVLISSHILSELSEFCNAIGVMEKGNMILSGTVEDIRKKMGIKGELIVAFSSDICRSRDRLLELFRKYACISNVREEGQEFKAYFTGDKADATQLLADIVNNGMPVSGFHIKEADIEDIFLKIGAREVM
jgi:ABC-2 type transport system ATP-binding protein